MARNKVTVIMPFYDPWHELKESIDEYDGKLRKFDLWDNDLKAMTPHGDMIDCIFPGDEAEYGSKTEQKGYEAEEYVFPNPYNSKRY